MPDKPTPNPQPIRPSPVKPDTRDGDNDGEKR